MMQLMAVNHYYSSGFIFICFSFPRRYHEHHHCRWLLSFLIPLNIIHHVICPVCDFFVITGYSSYAGSHCRCHGAGNSGTGFETRLRQQLVWLRLFPVRAHHDPLLPHSVQFTVHQLSYILRHWQRRKRITASFICGPVTPQYDLYPWL
jgi:hypothetical protein